MPQPGEPLYDAAKDHRSAVTILNVGGMDDGVNQIALGVGEEVPLAAFDLFASVIASRPATFRRFDALAIDHTRTWRGLTPLCFTDQHEKSMVQRLP